MGIIFGFEGAFSTILGVITLATVDAYMIRTFFKTVFLVIVIGALHGLVFLPVLLSLFVRKTTCGSGAAVAAAAKEKEAPSPSNLSQRSAISGREKPSGPYGRYGIYLPRLSHVVQYHPGKGEILQWSHREGSDVTSAAAAGSLGTPARAQGIMGGRLLPIRHAVSPIATRPPQISSSTMMSFRGGGDEPNLADSLSIECRNSKIRSPR